MRGLPDHIANRCRKEFLLPLLAADRRWHDEQPPRSGADHPPRQKLEMEVPGVLVEEVACRIEIGPRLPLLEDRGVDPEVERPQDLEDPVADGLQLVGGVELRVAVETFPRELPTQREEWMEGSPVVHQDRSQDEVPARLRIELELAGLVPENVHLWRHGPELSAGGQPVRRCVSGVPMTARVVPLWATERAA
jgi:hypothetical protein